MIDRDTATSPETKTSHCLDWVPGLAPALAVAGIVDILPPLNPHAPIHEGYRTQIIPLTERLALEGVGTTMDELQQIITEYGSNAVLMGSNARRLGVGSASLSKNAGRQDLFWENPDATAYRANSIYHFAPAILFPPPKRYGIETDLDVVVFNQPNLPASAVPCRSIPGAYKTETTFRSAETKLNVSYIFAPPFMSYDSPWMNWVKYFSICGSDSCVVAGRDGKPYAFLPSGRYGTVDRSVDTVFSPETKLDPKMGMWGVRHGVYMAYFSAINGVRLGHYGIYDLANDMAQKQNGCYPEESYGSLAELLCKIIPACRGNEPRNMGRFREELTKMGLMDTIVETVQRHGSIVGFKRYGETVTLNRLFETLMASKTSYSEI